MTRSCVLYLPTPAAAVDAAAGEQVVSLSDQSEELRLAILGCLKQLFTAADNTREGSKALKLQLASTSHIHFVAYLISSLLHIAENDKYRDAALLAMETLVLIVRGLGNDPVTLRQFFPGITGGVWKCVNAPNQASKVIVAAVGCLSEAIDVCLADKANVKEPKKEYSLESIQELAHTATYPLNEESTEDANDHDKWLAETAVNLDFALARIFAVGQRSRHQSAWRVRRALADLCGTVVLRCRSTLHESFFRCFEELLVFQVDQILSVAEVATLISGSLTSTLSTTEWLEMLPAFGDRFQSQLATLELKCTTEHEAFSTHVMKKMIGYVSFLGSKAQHIVDRMLPAVFKSLTRVLEFESMDIDLIVHQTIHRAPTTTDHEATLVVSHYQKRLKHFHEQDAVDTAFDLMHALGRVATPAAFIDTAFSILTPENAFQDSNSELIDAGGQEVMLLLNEFLRAHSMNQPSDTISLIPVSPEQDLNRRHRIDVHVVGRVLEDLLALDVWSEPRSEQEDKTRMNQRALMAECVGICVETLQRDFAVFLLDVLYPLVEKLGSRSLQVERAALATLSKIYFLCDYQSMEALFETNMDYFVDALCSRLENLDEFPLSALVVEALLQHTKITSLPLADEVTHALLRSIDIYQESPFTDALLRSLHALLRSIARSAQDTQQSYPPIQKAKEPLLSRFIAEMKAFVPDNDEEDDGGEVSRFEMVKESEESEPSVKGAMPVEYDEADDARRGAGNADDDEDSDDSLNPLYRSLIVEVLDRSGYFVATPDPLACCQVLTLMEDGFILLARSQKQLLPLIHTLWPSLLPRLRAESRVIVAATAHVISTLARVSGDFIGRRFVEDVWPLFRLQLGNITISESSSKLTRSMLFLDGLDTKENNEGEGTHIVPLGRKTQEIRQLLAILECISTVAKYTDAVSSLVPEVLASCAKYLHQSVPTEIVEATTTLLLALFEMNGNDVFFAVASLAGWEPPHPPTSNFPPFSLDSTRLVYQSHYTTFDSGTSLVPGCAANAQQLMGRLSSER